jgi:hypothetical protein
MNAPKPASPRVTSAEDPAVAAFDGAREEALTDDERRAFEEAMNESGVGTSSEELLQRLRPKP